METFRVPSSELVQRIIRFQRALRDKEIDAALIVQRVDLFYFSGTAQNGYLYIPAEGAPLLMIKKYFPRAREESALEHIVEVRSIREISGRISDFNGTLPRVIGLELDVMPVNYFYKIQENFKSARFVDAAPMIFETRMIKSEWEIRQMEKSAELSEKTYAYMRSAIKPGLSEMEFAGIYEAYARTLGHGALLRVRAFLAEGYPWHVLSGKSGGMVGLLDSPMSGEGTSAAFPCGAGQKRIESGEPVMVDFSFVFNGYHTDETRMFAIGSLPDKTMRACQAVIEIRNTVLERVKPGVMLHDLYQASISKAKSLGYEDQYLGPPGYKVTFLGHGVGLELVEYPFVAKGRNQVLQPGMILAIEPKMIFETEFAAGIEDMFLVTDSGFKMISKVPATVFNC